jgi:hypothetical protein
MRFLAVIGYFFITHTSSGASMEYAGHMIVSGTCLIAVRDTESKDISPWLEVGEIWRGNRITDFDLFARKIWTKPIEYGSAPDPQPSGDGPRQRLIEVRARPQRGFASKPYEHLTLTASGENYNVDWYAGSIHNPPVLLPDQEYDFVLVERSFPRLYGSRVWHDIQSVSDAGRVLYDRDVCEVHQVGLTKKYIPTRHGLSRFSMTEMDARKHHFPHAESGRAVTCEALPGETPLTEISICGLCDRAYTQWHRDNATSP